jgi:hypothetical protein
MMHSVWRAAATAAIGCLAGAACLAVAFSLHPELSFDMDRDLPRSLTSGFYGIEQSGVESFVWTSPRAELRLAGLDRRTAWVCSVRVRGARPAGVPQPDLSIAIDGVSQADVPMTNDFQNVEIAVTERQRPGVTLALASSVFFVPGPSDRRALGVQLDRVACRPDGRFAALPPRTALAQVSLAGAILGTGLALTGVTAASAVGATLLVCAALAIPLSTGPALYTDYVGRIVPVAIWVVIPMVAAVTLLDRCRRQPLRQTARFAIAFSSVVLFLRLVALLHPSKALVDALFQAHRLEWVLSGRFYFTQPMPAGVQFPYAIGLYVFAAPWSLLTDDHVMLLRVVVCAAEAVAGALLYPLVARLWGDRLVAAMASALFCLVPLPYVVVGNANLTNAFGQAVALAAIVAAGVWSFEPGRRSQLVGLTALTTLALLSHVSTFALLLTTLGALTVLYRWLGGPLLHRPARAILICTAIAVVVAIALYYGHFGDVYRRLGLVGGTGTATSLNVGGAAPASVPLHVRATTVLALTVRAVGWPILALALIGAWRLATRGPRGRLALVLSAWGITYVVFVAGVLVAPIQAQFERYAVEFSGRVIYATYPAAVILAAHGGAWLWRAGVLPRAIAAIPLLVALNQTVQHWMGWFR